MDPKGVKLECYRYGTGPKLSRENFEDSLQAISVTKDITGKEDIQLSMFGTFDDPHTSMVPGDFAVLRDQAGRPWSWGRVSVVRSQLKRDPGGRLTHSPYAVMVQGWYDFLTRSKLHVNANSNRPTVGTMFNIKDWAEIEEGIKSRYGQPAGAILQFIISSLCRIRLPESLGGGWLGDEIPVVYDADTARQYAPEFEDLDPVTFGPLAPSLTTGFINTRSSDIGSIIANMFLFENSLVELIPYMSVGGIITQTTPMMQAPVNSNSPLAQQPAANTTPIVITSVGKTKLGKILGGQPVLVYRIKPFRADPLYASAVSKVHYTPEEVESGYLGKQLALYDEKTRRGFLDSRKQARAATTKLLFDNKMFAKTTFERAGVSHLPYDRIISMSRQRADTERINATTINAVPPTNSNTTVTDVDYLGLPITIDNQVEEHGLRLRIAKWGLFPPDNAPGNDVDVYYRAVAAQVMQFYKSAHLYEAGTLTLHFLHTLYFTEDQRLAQSTYDQAATDIEPGRWFNTMINEGREYFGYITSVTHNIQRMPTGALTGSTQLSFQRGHFAEMWDLLHGVNVPLGDIDRPQTQQQQNSKRKGTGGGGRSPQAASAINPTLCGAYSTMKLALDAFKSGTPSTRLWGLSPNEVRRGAVLDASQQIYNRVPSARPFWLHCWMLEATSVMDSASANEVATMLGTTATDAATKNYSASLWALAACGYVIERYWRSRQGYEVAKVYIRSVRRTNDGYHDHWAAIDFYVELGPNFAGEEPGALQIWASLAKLAEAKRIPFGGRGIYLNVNPNNGIVGVAPSEAGEASKQGLNYPPGGSSWIHYDLRASFGITRDVLKDGTRRNAFSTKWLGTDWTGDGADEITTGGTFPPPKVNPGDKDPIENGGIADSASQTFANIADPGFTKLDKYLRADVSPRCPGVSAYVQRRKAADPGGAIEARRVPVRDAIEKYYNHDGLKDPWLHAVTADVPNMYEVFELAQLVSAANPAPPPPPPIQPDESETEGDLYLAKDSSGNVVQAPLVMVFGGVNVNGQEARAYMKPYMEQLFSSNHVFIAANDKVDFDDCYDLAVDPSYNPRPAQNRVLYVFSNGVLPALQYLRAGAGPGYQFDKIYLVDAFLQGPIAAEFITDMKARPSTYTFIYTPIFSNTGNGMAWQTLNDIQQIQNLERKRYEGVGSTDMDKHMSANAFAVTTLRGSGIIK